MATSQQLIVVGVDGSAAAREALAWALEEAGLRAGRLRVVHAWTYPGVGAWYAGLPPPADAPALDAIERDANALLDTVLDEVVPADSDVPITRVAVEGGAAAVLIEAAKGASLLVVGSRGRGGFAELVLGSVSHQCVLHATCPVVVVRGHAAPQ